MPPEKQLLFEDLLDELFSHFEDPITARQALEEKASSDEDFKTKLDHYMKANNMQKCSEVLPDYMFAREDSDVEEDSCWEVAPSGGN
ncbi:MAG: hypothetical protein WC833_03265 [Bacteroidales bacterium]|jgi:hypothetical protein